MKKNYIFEIPDKLEKNLVILVRELYNFRYLIIFLGLIAFFEYGFELFNLHLTIDEEIASFLTKANIAWLSQGRWGMYILNRYLFPFTVIPFAPLFVALFFHLASILVFISSFNITEKLDQYVIGAIGMTYSGMVFAYTFSTLNYGVGIGLFCTILSLFIFIKLTGLKKFWSIIPAAFAISIYQGFVPGLISIYLLYLIDYLVKNRPFKLKLILQIIFVNVAAALIYFGIQQLFLLTGKVPITGYINQFFDLNYLRENFLSVINKLFNFMFQVYSGSKSVYGLEISVLGFLIIFLALGISYKILSAKNNFFIKVLSLFLCVIFLLVPFASGLVTKGSLAMRFLVGLPFVFSGWVLLGLTGRSFLYKFIASILSFFCVFQFILSSNYLFSSSSIALEQDRILATNLIFRIQQAKNEVGRNNLKYIEIIGYPDNSSSKIDPKIETFGMSFFEWDQGNVWRVNYFLRILGYDELQPLPMESRGILVENAEKMAVWPDKGSVKIIDDIVIVKFSPYSTSQKTNICKFEENLVLLRESKFCP